MMAIDPVPTGRFGRTKLALRSWARDHLNVVKTRSISFAVRAVLYLAALVFLLAVVAIGLAALFHWLEIKYGTFAAFGSIGGLLFGMSAICGIVAAFGFKAPGPRLPSLASRLRVAIKADVASGAATLVGPATSSKGSMDRAGISTQLLAGAAAVILLGWVGASRRKRSAPVDKQ